MKILAPKSSAAEMAKFLDGVIGVVDANSYEQLSLWQENRLREKPQKWEEFNSGLAEHVGDFGGMPTVITLFKARVGGHLIVFIDATSRVVDDSLIEAWLERTLPKTAFNDRGVVNRVNAMNFHNVFP